jgi:hypothetical protein
LRDFATDDVHGMREGQPVRVLVSLQGGFVH